jgi:outer membrane lipopolysaccharide assembly protein LptE/RlpB
MSENDAAKDDRIKELEALVASIQARLRAANTTIEQYQSQIRRSYRDNYDYLPYEDDDRDR